MTNISDNPTLYVVLTTLRTIMVLLTAYFFLKRSKSKRERRMNSFMGLSAALAGSILLQNWIIIVAAVAAFLQFIVHVIHDKE